MAAANLLRVISLGAGVQSTTMALMAAHGEIGPMPDCAIFADTQSEPESVYSHLRWLTSPNVLPFPVHIVTKGSLRDKIGKVRPQGAWAHQPIPAFVVDRKGNGTPLNRDCTRDFKIAPIQKKVRELVGLTRKRTPDYPIVEQWIGISLDEAMRVRQSRHAWITLRYPLIERRMTRGDCLEWLKRHDYPMPPKSACTFCPFHSDKMWRDIKDNDPVAWNDAVAVDAKVRGAWQGKSIFLHRSLKPLAEVDLSTAEDHGQLNLFNNECEGMCGV